MTKTQADINTSVPANLTHWLAVSANHWGKGATRGEALANLRRAGRLPRRPHIVIYRVSPEVVIDNGGFFVYTYWPGQEYQREVEVLNGPKGGA